MIHSADEIVRFLEQYAKDNPRVSTIWKNETANSTYEEFFGNRGPTEFELIKLIPRDNNQTELIRID